MKRISRKYVALGDSGAAGHGARGGGYPERLLRRLDRAGFPFELMNFSRNGATAEAVRREQLDRAAAGRPDLCTVGVGINDLRRGFTPETFERHLDEIAGRLRDGGAEVVLLGMPDVRLAPAAVLLPDSMLQALGGRLEAFDERVRAVAERTGSRLVDLWGASADVMPGEDFFCSDGFHPSDAGYEVIAELLWPAVAAAAAARAA